VVKRGLKSRGTGLPVWSDVPVMMDIVRTRSALRDAVANWRKSDLSVALVPTMGALHEGHLDLVRAAKQRADRVITTIFVNPTQFAAHEDLGRYPRDEARDASLLKGVGCDLIYAPNASEMYPEGFSTHIRVSGVTQRLEGSFRPHFFAGVAIVVAKLFSQSRPDFAFFGEKDWQQLQVVTQMARDLDLNLDVIGVPTRREADGLAMSSRNAYLTEEERVVAPALKRALDVIYEATLAQPSAVAAIAQDATANLIKAGFTSVDYLEACHAQTLQPWTHGDPVRVLGAAWLGKTRLIDNRG
jgi:pantoate--beta-alanine ligase